MDIELLNKQLSSFSEKIARIIQDPNSDIVLNPGITLINKVAYAKSYININKLLDHPELKNEWSMAFNSILNVIYREFRFTAIVVISEPLARFIKYAESFFKEKRLSEKVFFIGQSKLQNLPHSEKVLVITDLILTGQIVAGVIKELTKVGNEIESIFSIIGDNGSAINTISNIAEVYRHYSFVKYQIEYYNNLPANSDIVLIIEPILHFYKSHIKDTIVEICDVNEELKKYLAKHPEYLYSLSPRRFEELIANILNDFGFEVQLTNITRDGGKDIIAYIRNEVCRLLTYIECKKYSPERKVGVEIVRSVYGVQTMHRANKSMIVTTSFFTKGAKEEVRKIQPQMDLKDFESIKKWLVKYRN